MREKKEQAETNRQRVFSAVKDLRKASTSVEIFEQVKRKLLPECEKEFENLIASGKIPSTNNEKYWKKIWRQKGITLRTVQRQLRSLKDEGFLNYQSKHYSLSDLDYPEIKIWAKDFGHLILFSAMKRIFPHYNRLEYNITRLVEIFGVYLVYCFIEAARPFLRNNGMVMSGERRDELAISWIDNMLQPRELFYYFVTFAKTQFSDQDVRNTRKKIFAMKDGKYILQGSIHDYIRHLSRLMFTETEYPLKHKGNTESNETKKSILEINDDIAEKLKKILLQKYPTIYLEMEDTYNKFDVKNKEGVRPQAPKFNRGLQDSWDEAWSDLLERIPAWE